MKNFYSDNELEQILNEGTLQLEKLSHALKIRTIWLNIYKNGINHSLQTFLQTTDSSSTHFSTIEKPPPKKVYAMIHLIYHYYQKSKRINDSNSFLEKFPQLEKKIDNLISENEQIN